MNVLDLPWNDEAEKRVLSILLSPSGNAAAMLDELTAEEHVVPENFYGSENRKIFIAIKKLCDAGERVDIATVANAINYAASEQGMSELKYIASIMTVHTALKHYAKIIRELAERRKYMEMARTVLELSADTSQPFNQIEHEINRAIEKNEESGAVCAKDVLGGVYADIVTRYSSPKKLSGLPTEWKQVNKLTGGLGKGEFIIIGGRPGMGKSIVGENIAYYTALKSNKKSIIFTLEMPKEQVIRRMLSAKTGIAYRKFKSGEVNDDDFYNLGLALESQEFSNILVDDNSRASVEHIKAVCRAEKRRNKELGIIVIDYIGLMQLPPKCRSRWEGVGEISRELKLLAKELDCPVVALSQINRETERDREKRPTLADLRDAGSLEQDADMVFLLYRDEYYFPKTPDKGIIEIIVAKARDGCTGAVKLSWQPQVMRVMDPADVAKIKKRDEELLRKRYREQEQLTV